MTPQGRAAMKQLIDVREFAGHKMGSGAVPTLAEKLDALFGAVHPRGREYTHEEVARGAEAIGGPTISATYVWQLRKGMRDNPTKHHLEALAGFFGVPPAYFFDDEASDNIAAELEMLAALRDEDVRNVAMRAASLTPEARAALAQLIEQLDTRPSGN